jgi:ATP-dependent DNA ligase
VLIDGEIIVQDANGVSDFAALRAAIEWEPNGIFDLIRRTKERAAGSY